MFTPVYNNIRRHIELQPKALNSAFQLSRNFQLLDQAAPVIESMGYSSYRQGTRSFAFIWSQLS